ncbi:MAG: plasmid recombination protein [Clostridiales bacterium]|nr:plasmid recombination protein [Clostridiales bacterium]
MPFDVQKYKARGGSSYREVQHCIRYRNEPHRNVQYGNPDIDPNKTALNYTVGIRRDDPYGYIKKKIQQYDEINPPKRIKKDRVTLCSFCFTVPESIANTPQECEYFQHCYDWLAGKVGAENIACADVHLDEIHDYYDSHKKEWVTSRAHMHAITPPVVAVGTSYKVNANEFLTRSNIKAWHTELDAYIHERMGVHDLVNDKSLACGRDHDTLKRESLEAAARMRDDIDRQIADHSMELQELDTLCEAERAQINATLGEEKEKAEQAVAEFEQNKHRLNQEYLEKEAQLQTILAEKNELIAQTEAEIEQLLDRPRKKALLRQKSVTIDREEYETLKDCAEEREHERQRIAAEDARQSAQAKELNEYAYQLKETGLDRKIKAAKMEGFREELIALVAFLDRFPQGHELLEKFRSIYRRDDPYMDDDER